MSRAMNVKVLLSLLLFFVSLTIAPKTVLACWCLKPELQTALDQSVNVFLGEVIEISYDQAENEPTAKAGSRAYRFEVDRVWKGVEQPRMIVYSDKGLCGFKFEKGKSYLVYTYDKNGEPYSNACGRTAELSMAGQDVKALGAGRTLEKIPRTEASEAEALENERWPFAWKHLADALAVAAFAILLWMSQKSRRKR